MTIYDMCSFFHFSCHQFCSLNYWFILLFLFSCIPLSSKHMNIQIHLWVKLSIVSRAFLGFIFYPDFICLWWSATHCSFLWLQFFVSYSFTFFFSCLFSVTCPGFGSDFIRLFAWSCFHFSSAHVSFSSSFCLNMLP